MNTRKAQLCAVCATVLVLAFQSRSLAQDVEVYTDSTAQLIRGFGGAFIEFWQPDLPAGQVDTAFGLDEGQLGLSILRLGINPDSTQWSENLEAAKRASEMGALIFASPWNAPDTLLKTKLDSTQADTIDVEKYDQYAAHLRDFNTYMANNGVDLYAVSVQNEPDYAGEWTGWTSENMVTFLKNNAPSVGALIMAPESFQFRKDFSDPILLDSIAAAHTDIIGGHIYGGGNSSYPLAEEKGKEVWMTEYLLNDYTGDGPNGEWQTWTEEQKWAQTMRMLRTVHKSMKSNMNAYIWWYLRRYYSFVGDGEQGEPAGVVTKRGFAFSQFSRFVRPHYVRVHSFGPVGRGYLGVMATAYRDTMSRKLVIVAINDEPDDRVINFNIDGLGSATFGRYITSLDQNVERLEDVVAMESSFTATLPTKTITTFVAEGVTVDNEQAGEIPSGFGLEQNYPNPFNPETVISYELPARSTVNLRVFDVHGREVRTLVEGEADAGRHHVRFDASGLSSGVYFYTLRAGNASITKGMLLAR
jgi:glucuronoarabinoxylan endo-1,4-beta-xylanase